jgi:hypothetical protein
VEQGTRQFVRAVVDGDQAKIAALLDSQAVAYNWGKAEIVSGAVYYARESGLSGARVLGLEIEREGDALVSYLAVWSDHAGGSLPVGSLNSRWKLQWQRQGRQWLLREIIPLQIGQAQRDAIEQRYLRDPVR